MKKVRFGVVGLGNMGVPHARSILGLATTVGGSKDQSKVGRRPPAGMLLGAVCDREVDKAERLGAELGVPYFADAQDMYASGLIDAVIIATPHYWHAPLAISAARAGLHVLCEKPLASRVGPARAAIGECRRRKVALGTMLQQRTRSVMVKMKQMVESGRIGEIFRVSMICSSWYRTQFYYDSGAWRGTWDGEGGGVLINQAPHSLDLFQWMGGMPKKITAVVNTRLHNIEVENTANVICEYEGGKTGYIYATTAEAPGMEQLMVCGDKGTLVAEGRTLRLARLKMPISKHLFASKDLFTHVPCEWEEVKLPKGHDTGHLGVIKAFTNHLLHGKEMIATGAEAIGELEISNAVYISGYKGKSVDIPVDAGEIDRLIKKLERERSTGRGQGERAKADREMRKLSARGK